MMMQQAVNPILTISQPSEAFLDFQQVALFNVDLGAELALNEYNKPKRADDDRKVKQQII